MRDEAYCMETVVGREAGETRRELLGVHVPAPLAETLFRIAMLGSARASDKDAEVVDAPTPEAKKLRARAEEVLRAKATRYLKGEEIPAPEFSWRQRETDGYWVLRGEWRFPR